MAERIVSTEIPIKGRETLLCKQGGGIDELWTWKPLKPRGVSAWQGSFHKAAAALLSRNEARLSQSHKIYICPWMVGSSAGKDVLEWLLEAPSSVA